MNILTESQLAEAIAQAATQIANHALQNGIPPNLFDLIAEKLADRIEEAQGDIASKVVLPMKTVEVLVALSSKQIPHYLAVTETAKGKHGVTLGNVLAHITSKTVEPKKKEAA